MSDRYHELTRAERDHLVAIATADTSPSGTAVQKRVERLRGGERPSNNTTYRVLDALEADGLVEDSDPNGMAKAWRLTDDGGAVLDAAADLLAP